MLRPDGVVATEAPVETRESTKVPDVPWISRALHLQLKNAKMFTIAPEICVEVVSPGNTPPELLAEGSLYFAAGAQEFWICDGAGVMTFFDPTRELERSGLCPDFPLTVEND